jgi:hypothetical protein
MESDSKGMEYQRIYDMVEYFSTRKYNQYLPTVGPYPNFIERLRDWLNMLDDENDQKSLFRLLPHIFFITQLEFATLYRAAFKEAVTQWLIDTEGISFDAEDFKSQLLLAEKETWFCPMTDSMEIAAFCHANHIEGQELRPDWYSLSQLGNHDSIISYMRDHSLKRLVLLEDFVGSGNQVAGALRFAASFSSTIPVLAVPLVICSRGVDNCKIIAGEFNNFRFKPIVPLPKQTCINPEPVSNEPNIFGSIRELLVRISDRVSGIPKDSKYYSPFGYQNTGALVVTYSNCPDNTLPVIRLNSNTWKALFPRSSRI